MQRDTTQSQKQQNDSSKAVLSRLGIAYVKKVESGVIKIKETKNTNEKER